jgi:hypothetical protein
VNKALSRTCRPLLCPLVLQITKYYQWQAPANHRSLSIWLYNPPRIPPNPSLLLLLLIIILNTRKARQSQFSLDSKIDFTSTFLETINQSINSTQINYKLPITPPTNTQLIQLIPSKWLLNHTTPPPKPAVPPAAATPKQLSPTVEAMPPPTPLAPPAPHMPLTPSPSTATRSRKPAATLPLRPHRGRTHPATRAQCALTAPTCGAAQ